MLPRLRVPTLAAATAATAALVGLTVAPAGAAPTARPAPHTTVTQVLPVTSTGHLAAGYKVTETSGAATCTAGSEVSAQGYRCFFGNVVADPCFPLAATTGFTVACLADPFTTHVAVVTGTGELEPTSGHTERPWGVQLTNGTTCTLAQGAHSMVGGKVLQYYCSASTGLVGYPDTRHSPATIQAASYTKLKGTYTVKRILYAGFTH